MIWAVTPCISNVKSIPMNTMKNIMNQSWHFDHGPNHEEQAACPISINNCYITTVVYSIMEIREIKRLMLNCPNPQLSSPFLMKEWNDSLTKASHMLKNHWSYKCCLPGEYSSPFVPDLSLLTLRPRSHGMPPKHSKGENHLSESIASSCYRRRRAGKGLPIW